MTARERLRADDETRWSLIESRQTGVPEHLVWARTRRMARVSQGDLARRLGVSTIAVSNWETGRYRPTRGNRLALCAELERLTIERVLVARVQSPVVGPRRRGRPRLDGDEIPGSSADGQTPFVPARESSIPRRIALLQARARYELDRAG